MFLMSEVPLYGGVPPQLPNSLRLSHATYAVVGPAGHTLVSSHLLDPSGDISRGMVRTGGGKGVKCVWSSSLENEGPGSLLASVVPPAPTALHRRGRRCHVPLLGARI